MGSTFFQPFSDAKVEDQEGFLTPPSKCRARAVVEAMLKNPEASASSSGEEDKVKRSKENENEQNGEAENPAPNTLMKVSGVASNDGNLVSENDLKRKSICSFPQPPAKTMKTAELDVYLSEQLWGSSSSLLYWKSADRFPQLQGLAMKLLAIPATSGGFDRLYPMAACIVKAKRNRLPPHTTERLLLYKNSLKTKTVKKSGGVAKH